MAPLRAPCPPVAMRISARRMKWFGTSDAPRMATCTRMSGAVPTAAATGPMAHPVTIAPLEQPSCTSPISRLAEYALRVACASDDDCIISSSVIVSCATYMAYAAAGRAVRT
ncbi:MAG: hypothetical protein ACJ0BI_05535 [Paracoccaceae bacterium]